MKVDLTKFTETHEFHFDEVFGHLCTTRDVRCFMCAVLYMVGA